MKIFFHFIEISIILIFLLNSKITNLKLRKQLSKELVTDYLTIKNNKPKKENILKIVNWSK